MPANSSLIMTNLDFDVLKNTFKAFMKSQSRFNDYDFDGSNMNVLLDLLAYNTYMNSFYLNMIGNEMFLDTAQLRESVVSHAKELNYVPRSFTSAVATVNIELKVEGATSRRSATIPKGTTFSSRIGGNTFTFSTDQIIVTDTIRTEGSNSVYIATNVEIFEGEYVTETFTVNYSNPSKFIISAKNIDISSLTVNVIEDIGATPLEYRRASSLFGLNAASKVFFVQGAQNEQYEIVFGDGTTGRAPKDNSVIVVEYRISNGELPNGAYQFTADTSIDGITNVRIVTQERAAAGTVSESIDSIRYNAPRHFTTQERAITTEDYETLMKLNFPEINTVTAYGGEEVTPPQFGKVFVAVDLKEVDGLPDIKKDIYYKFLKPRSPVSIDPVFIDPDYMYIQCLVNVNYNINLTSLNIDDIRSLVISKILEYAETNLNDFKKTLRYSKLVQSIDSAHPSVISNETEIFAVRYLTPITNEYLTFDIDFKFPLERTIPDTLVHSQIDKHTVSSTPFVFEGLSAYLEDDGAGGMRVVSTKEGNHQVLAVVGTINYDTGLIQIDNLKIDSYTGNYIKIYADPLSKDVFSTRNTILNINESDITVVVNQVRE